MRFIILAIAGLSTVAAVTVQAQIPPASPPPALHEPVITPEIFVEKATLAGMYEVEAGKLALSRSTDPGVKAFAQRMVTDHSAAAAELAGVVARTSYPIPSKLDAEHEDRVKKLRSASGAKFDMAYGKDMMDEHERAVTLFTQASSATEVTPELRGFARKTLPTLQSHYEAAKSLPHPEK
jgi:putative membrane protein